MERHAAAVARDIEAAAGVALDGQGIGYTPNTLNAMARDFVASYEMAIGPAAEIDVEDAARTVTEAYGVLIRYYEIDRGR